VCRRKFRWTNCSEGDGEEEKKSQENPKRQVRSLLVQGQAAPIHAAGRVKSVSKTYPRRLGMRTTEQTVVENVPLTIEGGSYAR